MTVLASYFAARVHVRGYRFRRIVPLELRDIIGQREIKVSLRATDPDTAKRRLAEEMIKADRLFEEARRSPATFLKRRQTAEARKIVQENIATGDHPCRSEAAATRRWTPAVQRGRSEEVVQRRRRGGSQGEASRLLAAVFAARTAWTTSPSHGTGLSAVASRRER